MHVLSAIWLLATDSIPNNLPPDAGKKFDNFTKIAVPILSALVPAAVAALFKWLQDHDLRRRRSSLIEQLAGLAKHISELPVLPEPSGDAVARMRMALNSELESGVRELTQLQAHVPRRLAGVTPGVSSIVPGIKSMFLWWRPRGFSACMLHLAFYASLIFLGFMTLGFSVDGSEQRGEAELHKLDTKIPAPAAAPTPKPAGSSEPTSPGIVIAIYVIFGIPPLIFRHFAAGIHRRQCAADAALAAAAQAVRAAGPTGWPSPAIQATS
jgi:hypothetical protein